jgi:isoamylase
MTLHAAHIEPGRSHPLGATPRDGGVNFSVYARGADRLELLLYDRADDVAPSAAFILNASRHRKHHYWHVFVPGVAAGQIYAWRAHGPLRPERGLRFDAGKVLLDPYGRAVAMPAHYSRAAAAVAGSNDGQACKSVVVDVEAYDWEGDVPLHRPVARTVIYELHVGGFTRHPNSGVIRQRRGTFAGLVEKIPYLVHLGITAVELMPVFHFDIQDAPSGLSNYWGYSPMSYFAPHAAYGTRPYEPLSVLDEFRDMVKALHRAGLEVILDVVFNHTSEGNEKGPTFCWRGLAEGTYYMLDGEGRYANYSGTGNTLNANHSVVRRLILDSLHYWVDVMHVDGFRFDLAAILSRDEQGHPQANPPVVWDIESDPILAGTKLIAEAWDAAGLYQVGHFVGETWKEWNGQYRDDVRAFVRGDSGMVARLAERLTGSPDLYGERPREPEQSINFVTCHDGFTLNDLVSYDHKHNEANLEGNRDGSDHNLSWNCGVEGDTDDPFIEALRARQIRNLLTINVFSLGMPMLLMGDEVRRSQRGNNNAYCQDNELSWFDWSAVQRNADLVRFVRGLIRLRLMQGPMRHARHLTLAELISHAEVELHGVQLGQPDKGHESHALAVTARSLSGELLIHFGFNAYWESLAFELPDLPVWAGANGTGWRRVVDTSQPAPQDLVVPEHAELVAGRTHSVAPRSVVLLFAAARALRIGPL